MSRILLHASDPHFGAFDPQVAESFLEEAKRLSPDFTVVSGDFTMRARWRELIAAGKFIRQLPEPRMIIPGNHDIPGFNHLGDRFFRPFRRYRRAIAVELEPQWLGAGLRIVGLNSSRAFGLHSDWSEGRLSGEQLERMKVAFTSTPPGSLRVLVLHHPLIVPEGLVRATVKPLPALLAALGEARVDLVLCGHYHRSLVKEIECPGGWKCVVSQASTVCSTRLQGEPQGFHEIRYDSAGFEIVRWIYNGDCFERA